MIMEILALLKIHNFIKEIPMGTSLKVEELRIEFTSSEVGNNGGRATATSGKKLVKWEQMVKVRPNFLTVLPLRI